MEGINVICKSVIEKDGKYLLIKESTKKEWDFPGGRLEPGENITDCAIREADEESGLKINPIGIAFIENKNSRKNLMSAVYLIFFSELVGGEIKFQNETTDAKFLSYSEIKALSEVKLLRHQYILGAIEAIKESRITPLSNIRISEIVGD